AQDPELAAFETQHRENKSARVRAHEEGSRDQGQQTDADAERGVDVLAPVVVAHVEEVKRADAEENDDLRPLGRVAAKGAEVLDDEHLRLRIEKEEGAREDVVEPVPAVAPAQGSAGRKAI